ncbi:MAG TPA: HEAT repeat domain-containing protein, partial [bacterium (Candidatus Stahlbacteria)]|nr:HEAT repeat domain-containing protein [Candidatus Stahlbacteria bacterium]
AKKIAKMGEAVLDRLLELSESGVWFTRAAAALGLGELGMEPAVPSLARILKKDRNRTVIKEATVAIARILIRNHRDISYLDQFGIRMEFLSYLNEYARELKPRLGLKSD